MTINCQFDLVLFLECVVMYFLFVCSMAVSSHDGVNEPSHLLIQIFQLGKITGSYRQV